jgi:hypothetical protein
MRQRWLRPVVAGDVPMGRRGFGTPTGPVVARRLQGKSRLLSSGQLALFVTAVRESQLLYRVLMQPLAGCPGQGTMRRRGFVRRCHTDLPLELFLWSISSSPY